MVTLKRYDLNNNNKQFQLENLIKIIETFKKAMVSFEEAWLSLNCDTNI